MDGLALINFLAAVFRALVEYTSANDDLDLEGFGPITTVVSVVTFVILAVSAYLDAGQTFAWNFWVWLSLASTAAAFAKEIGLFSAWLVLREIFRFKDLWRHQ